MFDQLLAVDCRNSCVVYDDYRIGGGDFNSSDCRNNFCRRNFLSFSGCGNNKPRHLRQADYIRNRRLDTYCCDEKKLVHKGAAMTIWKTDGEQHICTAKNNYRTKMCNRLLIICLSVVCRLPPLLFLFLCLNIDFTPKRTVEILEFEERK